MIWYYLIPRQSLIRLFPYLNCPCLNINLWNQLSWITAQGETLHAVSRWVRWHWVQLFWSSFQPLLHSAEQSGWGWRKGESPAWASKAWPAFISPPIIVIVAIIPLVIQQYHHYPYPLRSRQRPDKDWGWGRFGNRTSQLVAKPQNLGSNATFLLKWVHFWCVRIFEGGKYRLITWILKMQWLS